MRLGLNEKFVVCSSGGGFREDAHRTELTQLAGPGPARWPHRIYAVAPLLITLC